MSAEVVPIRSAELEVEAPPVVIPPHVVLAIATAAVEAYKQGVREQRREYNRAYWRANRDVLLQKARERRELRRLHPVRED